MSHLITPELLQHVGKTEAPRTELVTRRDIRKYSVATGQHRAEFLRGEVAPPMFHIALFWDVVEMSELSPDGVFIDKLLPEFPLKRAMAGGWKIDYFKPIHPGDVLTATRTLTDIYEKQGSKGPLIFYDLVTEVVDDDGEAVLAEKITRILR